MANGKAGRPEEIKNGKMFPAIFDKRKLHTLSKIAQTEGVSIAHLLREGADKVIESRAQSQSV